MLPQPSVGAERRADPPAEPECDVLRAEWEVTRSQREQLCVLGVQFHLQHTNRTTEEISR